MTKRQAFLLSVAYVMGMAITYALAGIGAGLSGTLLSNALQNPWVLSAFAGLFVLLSLSMFGFYDLQLPSSLQSKLSDTSNKVKGGTFWGVFVMGVLSALIVGPCVAAPLAGAYERQAIRPHVLGKFRDLLEATAKSPAMLFYLDNWMSADPNGPHPDDLQMAPRFGPLLRSTSIAGS
jgi:cytochrome c biogenesis protein CcdA